MIPQLSSDHNLLTRYEHFCQFVPKFFFKKFVRIANQGVHLMGTLKGAWDAGRTLYGGLSTAATYARPLLALA